MAGQQSRTFIDNIDRGSFQAQFQMEVVYESQQTPEQQQGETEQQEPIQDVPQAENQNETNTDTSSVGQ